MIIDELSQKKLQFEKNRLNCFQGLVFSFPVYYSVTKKKVLLHHFHQKQSTSPGTFPLINTMQLNAAISFHTIRKTESVVCPLDQTTSMSFSNWPGLDAYETKVRKEKKTSKYQPQKCLGVKNTAGNYS